MCGLFGIIGQGITKDDLSVFKDLMVFSAVRGIDSTGYAAGRADNPVSYVAKKIGDPIYFLQTLTKPEESDLDNVSYNYFLGHTRWATKGEKTKEAAQPFSYLNIVGTHNGTIETKFDGFHSDSDALFHRINEIGLKATIAGLSKNDSYALVYLDKKTKTINFLRNHKRPLYFAVHPKRNTLYYSSENGILHAALWRHAIDAKTFYFTEDTLFTFDPQKLRSKKDELNYKCTDIKIHESANNADKTAPFDGGTKVETKEGPSADV